MLINRKAPRTIKKLLEVPINVVIEASTYFKEAKVKDIPINGPSIDPIPI